MVSDTRRHCCPADRPEHYHIWLLSTIITTSLVALALALAIAIVETDASNAEMQRTSNDDGCCHVKLTSRRIAEGIAFVTVSSSQVSESWSEIFSWPTEVPLWEEAVLMW